MKPSRRACLLALAWGMATSACAFTISGTIIDDEHILLEMSMDEGEPWSGDFDAIAQRLVHIRAYSGDQLVIETHPDGEGRFALASDEAITSLELEVDGGAFYVRQSGTWSEDAKVDFRIANLDVFTLDGFVKNPDGTDRFWEMIKAYDEHGRAIAYGYTQSKGNFKIRSNTPIHKLALSTDKLMLNERGPWSEDAHMTLTLAPRETYAIRGTVRDVNGVPIMGARVVAYDTFQGVIVSVSSTNDGSYTCSTMQKVDHLRAYDHDRDQVIRVPGPWDDHALVDITL